MAAAVSLPSISAAQPLASLRRCTTRAIQPAASPQGCGHQPRLNVLAPVPTRPSKPALLRAPLLQLHRGLDRLDALVPRSNGLIERSLDARLASLSKPYEHPEQDFLYPPAPGAGTVRRTSIAVL